ncbi:MAG: hypothetical protein LBI20_01880 [Holosporales bacterium]|jgi:hypothetical protein|nr:hypothetical protein [Holosporales bacterium]
MIARFIREVLIRRGLGDKEERRILKDIIATLDQFGEEMFPDEAEAGSSFNRNGNRYERRVWQLVVTMQGIAEHAAMELTE